MYFRCDFDGCKEAFVSKQALKEHKKLHEERPFVCSKCKQTFTQNSSLKKHERVHDKKRPYICEVSECSKSFTQLSNLIRHSRLHTGEKPYKCEVCSKKFSSSSNMLQHLEIHKTKRESYPCSVPECGKEYNYFSSLKKHMLKSHPDEYTTLFEEADQEELQQANRERLSVSKQDIKHEEQESEKQEVDELPNRKRKFTQDAIEPESPIVKQFSNLNGLKQETQEIGNMRSTNPSEIPTPTPEHT